MDAMEIATEYKNLLKNNNAITVALAKYQNNLRQIVQAVMEIAIAWLHLKSNAMDAMAIALLKLTKILFKC